MNKKLILILISVNQFFLAISQDIGNFSGSFQSISHYYLNDKVLNTVRPDNPLASNNYIHLQYNNGPFAAGLQYEAYMPPLSGYPYQLEGNKITRLYLTFTKEIIELTVGNFYDQFGNGLIFRAFESRELGINTSLDGVRAVLRPVGFIRLTGVYGRPKKYLETSHSYMRGIDADIIIDTLLRSSTGLKFGAGIMSRYEPYTGSASNFPSTVNATSLRVSVSRTNLELNSEYVFKTDDPSMTNSYSYANGSAFLLNGSYATNGLGIFLSVRFLNNMDFRSERETEGNYQAINYLPSNTRQHTYLLTNIYPYSTQSEGEMSFQGELNYTIQEGKPGGGKYGTGIRINYSQARNLKIDENTGLNRLFSIGQTIYFQDINFEVSRKWDKKFKSIFTYINLLYNKGVIEGPGYDIVRSDIIVADLQYRITSYFSIRTELQHLWTKQDYGNWIAGLAEFGYSPHWSVFVSDMLDYQYVQKAHYLNTGISYTAEYIRVSAGYGRQREGQICSGGICQRVPSYRGFNLKLNVNF